jgi:hypothetical protein
VIIAERKLFGVLPYTTVFFPGAEAMSDIAGRLGTVHLARFFWSSVHAAPPSYVVRRTPTSTVCVDLTKTCDDLWSGLVKNCRNEIRSAERLGDRVRIVRNNSTARDDFLAIYANFARGKDGVAALNSRLLQRYQDHIGWFVAYLDDRPMCGHVFLEDLGLGRTRLLFSASLRLQEPQTARLCGNLNRLLHWHEIRTYRDDGFVTYDLGGISEDLREGIARFKTSFGGETVTENTYLCAGSQLLGAAVRKLIVGRGGRGDREGKALTGRGESPGSDPAEAERRACA